MKSRMLLMIPAMVTTLVAIGLMLVIHKDTVTFEKTFAVLLGEYDSSIETITKLKLGLLSGTAQFQLLFDQAEMGETPPAELYSSGLEYLDRARRESQQLITVLQRQVDEGSITKKEREEYVKAVESHISVLARAFEHTLFLNRRSHEVISEANLSQLELATKAEDLLAKLRVRRRAETAGDINVLHQKHDRSLMWIAALFCLVISVSLLVARRIGKRLGLLMRRLDGMHGSVVAGKRYGPDLENSTIRSLSEFDRLDEMANKLAEAFLLVTTQSKRLEDLSSSLDATVKARTAQLEQANVSLSDEIESGRVTERQLRLFERVISDSTDAIFITDGAGKIFFVNAAFEALCGADACCVKGQFPRDVFIHDYSVEFFTEMLSELADTGHLSRELRVGPKNASGRGLPKERRDVWLKASHLVDEFGAGVGMMGLLRDISEIKAYEQKLEQLAFTDELTGLLNRRYFETLLPSEIGQHRRSKQHMALLNLDLDNFKSVNDSLGHAAGDQVLKGVSKLLKSIVRATDIVCRRGGDEFTVLLTQVDDPEAAAQVSRKLIRGVEELYGDLEQQLGVTIGIALFPQDGEDPQSLHINADRAMYVAKARGKNCYETYSSELQRIWDQNRETESALRSGLRNLHLGLHFQPILDLATRKVVAAEALIRWPRDGHFVPPAEFIPLAERSDLILEIDTWVLDAACRQAKEWQEQENMNVGFKVHVNLSSKFIQRGDMSVVAQTLERHGLQGSALGVEITETAVISDLNKAFHNVQALRAIGMTVSLDDFGTGYSSLNHLASFPIDSVKIDREFIEKIDSLESSRVIVESISHLASRLGNDVIAEGVETEAQCEFAHAAGCKLGQGYFFGKPIAAAAFVQRWGSATVSFE